MNARVGEYVIEAEIGRGGMGRVFRARHVRTGAVRALKTLEDAEAIERFQREAEALAKAGGRVAVPIHESGSVAGRFYFVMDLMPGGSLRDRLVRAGAMPWQEAVAIAAKLARGLAALHEQGLVHRDLKPENILFGDDGAPRLADLGLVRDVSRSSLTVSGTLLGTIAYMAPEQLRGERAGPTADVFALGAVLHELIAGRPLFTGTPVQQLAARTAARSPLEKVPEALESLLDRALAPAPADRPDARAFAAALEDLREEPVAARPLSRVALALGAAAIVAVVVTGLLVRAVAPRPSVEPSPRAASPLPVPPTPPPSRAEILKRTIPSAVAITSADVTPGDLALLLGHEDLLVHVAAHGVLYARSDLDRLSARAASSDAFGVLWAYAALASRDAASREAANAKLRKSTAARDRELAEALEQVDAIARQARDNWSGGGLAHPLPTTIPHLAAFADPATLPALVFAGLLAPVEDLFRKEALEVRRRQFNLQGKIFAQASAVLDSTLMPYMDTLPPKLALELTLTKPSLLVRTAFDEAASVLHVTRLEVGGFVLLASNAPLLAPAFRRAAARTRETTASLEATDPLIAAAAWAYILNAETLAEVYEDAMDPRVEELGDPALAVLARARGQDDAETVAVVEVELETAIALHAVATATRTPDAARRATLAARGLEHARAAYTIGHERDWPSSDPFQSAAHLALRAALLEGDDLKAVEPHRDLAVALRASDWIPAEIARREGKLDTALAFLGVVASDDVGGRVPSPEERCAARSIHALAAIEKGRLDEARADIESLRGIAPVWLELPRFQPDELARRLAEAEASRKR